MYWSRFVDTLWTKVFPIAGVLIAVGLSLYFGGATSLDIIISGLILAVLIILGSYLLAGIKDIRTELGDIRKILEKGSSFNPLRNEEEEEEIKTSGAGALVGMGIGGAIGLIGGPVGVIVGGIVGALIGDQIEYEQIKEERKRKYK